MASRCTVLHIVHSLDAGGLENGVINVANSLDRDFDIQFACLNTRGRMAERVCSSGAVHELCKRPGFSTRTVWRLARLIRKLRPQVVHTHNLGPLIYAALATGFGVTVPILHGEHSQFSADDLGPARLRQRRLFYRATRQIHTVSRHQANELRASKLGPPARNARAIVNGVDTGRFQPGPVRLARSRLELPLDVPMVGIVGRFGPFKRHDMLIEAFESLRSRGTPAHLLIVGGGGPEEQRIRQRCAASPVAFAIHLLGFHNRPESIYPAIDVLAVPSVNEGLSNVVLEAMSCGIPALSHHACGSAEVITSGVDGVVADLSSPDSLSDHLERMLAAPAEMRGMGRRARECVIVRFSLESMAHEYAKLYRTLGTA